MSFIGSNNKLVLNDLSLDFKAGETVGFYSVEGDAIRELFGLIRGLHDYKDAFMKESLIRIAGNDIHTEVPIAVMRPLVGFLEEEPNVYSGTVFENIDPRGEFQKETIIDILLEAQFRNIIENSIQSQELQESVLDQKLDELNKSIFSNPRAKLDKELILRLRQVFSA